MDKNQVEGVVKKGVGHLQDGAGGLVGDNETQLKGKANETAGSVQQAYGDIKDKAAGLANDVGAKAQDVYGSADQFAREQPLAAVGIGVAIGFALGILLGAQIAEQSRPRYFRRWG